MALRNNGTGTASFGKTTNLPTYQHTVMLWGKITTDLNAYSTFAQIVGGSGAVYMTTTGDGTTFNLYNGSDNAGSALTVGTWYHLAYVNDGTDGAGHLLGYINGVQNISANGMTSAEFGTINRLWCLNDSDTEPLNGAIAAVKIYDAVLTAAEIYNEMGCYVPVRTANLNAWLPCIDSTKANCLIDRAQVQNMTEAGTAITVEDGPPIPWRLGRRRYSTYTAPVGGGATNPGWAGAGVW